MECFVNYIRLKIWRKKNMVKRRLDYILQIVQLYSYLLPTLQVGNRIMDFRIKYTLE